MTSEPLSRNIWEGFVAGTKIPTDLFGECEFYRYNTKRKRVEVFDRYGIVRYLLPNQVLDIPDSKITRP